ncbi:MAG: membrane or secreted protein [Bacteroidota bacterium]
MRFSILLSLFLLVNSACPAQIHTLIGAWESGPDENHITMIVAEHYFSAAVYNKKNNTYMGTCGGAWRIEKNQFLEVHEFNTMKPDWVGVEHRSEVMLKNDKLYFKTSERTEEFSMIDNGRPGELLGAWLITGRMTDQGMEKRTPGPRKTMKILSGTRFQWIAYNTETKEFFGTGGGSYTTEHGKYTENIEFFSRDNSRVGAKLQFDFSLVDGDWRHKGLSSKGDPIDEVWSKREKIEK